MNRKIGATFIVAGTTIGAGMLAMPMSAAPLGFLGSVSALIFLWAVMYKSATLMVKCSLLTSPGQSIAWIAGEVFGTWPMYLLSFLLILFLSALLAAYIDGGTSILSAQFENTDKTLLKFVFLGVFAIPLVRGTHWVDRNNRFMFAIMVMLLLLVIVLLSPYIQLENLAGGHIFNQAAWSFVLPVFFTSFGFHASIPSLIQYCGNNEKELNSIMFWGSFIPCLLYILWLLVTEGVLPLNGHLSFSSTQNGDLGGFLNLLTQITRNSFINIFSKIFAFLAIATSFLGVSIGLFDLINERLKLPRLFIVILTLGPAFLWSQIFQEGLIIFLKYAAVLLSIIAVIVPVLVLLKLRRGNIALNYGMLLFGLIIIILGI